MGVELNERGWPILRSAQEMTATDGTRAPTSLAYSATTAATTGTLTGWSGWTPEQVRRLAASLALPPGRSTQRPAARGAAGSRLWGQPLFAGAAEPAKDPRGRRRCNTDPRYRDPPTALLVRQCGMAVDAGSSGAAPSLTDQRRTSDDEGP